jgi:DNA invertase Pin-like site-specific DNA recombinase
MIYGYARVSTDGQSVDAQVKQLRAAGAEKVFRETASGAKTERRELGKALRELGEGDTLLVTRLDRLARSTPFEHARHGSEGWSRIPVAWRHMGGHHDTARAAHAHRAWRACRVRARVDPRQKREALARRAKGEETLREIARSYNVSHNTISRLEA